MNCQAVVDSSKRFLDLYVGMPGSTNDSRMLRRSTLFQRGQANTLWHVGTSFEGFSPYLLGDAGYPLLPWLMIPHRHIGHLSMADALFNRRLSRGRAVVENAFALLKGTFRELQVRSDLSITFIPDVVTACALLHNLLLQQSHVDVERLLNVLRTEGFEHHTEYPTEETDDVATAAENIAATSSNEKRLELGCYLSVQRARQS